MDKKNIKFYGEWVEYRTPEEREEALQFLAFWKKFNLRKLEMAGGCFVGEDFIDRPFPFLLDHGLDVRATLGYKMSVKMPPLPEDLHEKLERDPSGKFPELIDEGSI